MSIDAFGADARRHVQVVLTLPPANALHGAGHDALPEWPGMPGVPGIPSLAGTLAPLSPLLASNPWLAVVTCRSSLHSACQNMSNLCQGWGPLKPSMLKEACPGCCRGYTGLTTEVWMFCLARGRMGVERRWPGAQTTACPATAL